MDKPERAVPSAAAKRQKFQFFQQFGVNIVAALLLVGLLIAIGTVGYRHFAGMAWIDAFANAAMIVSGIPWPAQRQSGALLPPIRALCGLALVATTGLTCSDAALRRAAAREAVVEAMKRRSLHHYASGEAAAALIIAFWIPA
jgi:hypothetical protein